MRIRRRPPGGQQPLAYLLPSDPYPAPQPSPLPPPSRDPPPPGHKQQAEGEGELHLHPASATNHSAADLADARASSPLSRPALPPQDNGAVAVEERSSSLRGSGGLLGAQQQQQQLQQGPADGRSSSLENGLHRRTPEPVTNHAGELLSNNGVGAAVVAVTTPATTGAKATKKQKQETKDSSGGGTKRPPRGPGTLLEGSRCSRKNGRGWRCSQPTLVGYALCQYHLGKGRMKSGSAATVGRGPGQLGRTEHAAKKTSTAAVAPATSAATGGRPSGQLGRTEHAAMETSAAAAVAAAPATTGAPKADVPLPPQLPLPPSVQQC